MTESSASWERLPFHFKHNVVSLLDFESRYHLRLCSKSDHILVDSCSMNISKLAIFLQKTTVSLYFTCDTKSIRSSSHSGSLLSAIDLIKTFSRLISHPKTTVDELTIEFADIEKSKLLLEEIGRIVAPNWRINAKSLLWYTRPGNFYSVKFVEYLNTKTIESIRFENYSDDVDLLKSLMATAQWKKSKKLTSTSILPIGIDLKSFSRAQMFKIKVFESEFNLEKTRSLISNFIETDHPVGSYFSIESLRKPEMDDEFTDTHEPMWIKEKNVECNSMTDIEMPSGKKVLSVQRGIGIVRVLVRDNDDPIDYFII